MILPDSSRFRSSVKFTGSSVAFDGREDFGMYDSVPCFPGLEVQRFRIFPRGRSLGREVKHEGSVGWSLHRRVRREC